MKTPMLNELLGMKAEMPEEKEGEKEDSKSVQQVLLPYLLTLQKLVGAKRAIEIAGTTKPEELAEAKKNLDSFRFKDAPKTPKKKLEGILQMMKVKREIGPIEKERDKILESIKSYEEFRIVTDFMASCKDGESFDEQRWSKFNRMISVPPALLHEYGIPTTEPVPEGSYVGLKWSEKTMIPGISSRKIFEFLMKKESDEEPVNDREIKEGFNDVFAAMEAASKTNSLDRNDSLAEVLLELGFTSFEVIKGISSEELGMVKQEFGEKEDRGFSKVITNLVQGRKEKLESLVKLAKNGRRVAKGYLEAFDGSIEDTKRILNLAEESRPSAACVNYARNILKIYEFKRLVEFAKKIDVDGALKILEEYGDEAPKDIDEIVKLVQEYSELNKKYRYRFTNNNLSRGIFEKLKAFNEDPRFLEDCKDIDDAIVVSSTMDYDTFSRIGITDDVRCSKARAISTLVEKGYDARAIELAFKGKRLNAETVYDIACSLENEPLEVILEIAKMDVNSHYASLMLGKVEFGDSGTKIPYGTLLGLERQGITPEQLAGFVSSVKMERYETEDGFDTPKFFRELREVYNIAASAPKEK